MFTLIIGYSTFTDSLINFLNSADSRIILLSDQLENNSSIKKYKNLDFKYMDLDNYNSIFQQASSSMISKIYVYTNSDIQNLLIADNLSSLSNMTVIFNSNKVKKLTSGDYRKIFLDETFCSSL